MDFKVTCRTCLKSDSEGLDIYTCYYSKMNTLYSEMLANCTKIKPLQGDGLPSKICKECSRSLKRTYSFIILCEKSDHTLKSYLENNIKSEIEHTLKTETEKESAVKRETEKNGNADLLKIINSNTINIEIYGNIGGVSHKENENKLDIKSEYIDNDDSAWDADDDNIILRDIKTADIDKVVANGDANETTKKKKRGRKKTKIAGHLSLSKMPHQCETCGKILSTRSNLRQHMVSHTDLRPFKCTDCPSAFRGYSALFQHRRVHTGELPYNCEYCSKQFRRRTGLINHIKIHTGEKSFSCDICFKKFIQSAQLSIHMRRHKGDKTFLCQDCGKGFPIRADLIVHQRIHNGEKPYSCHLCQKTFATAGNLSMHLRIHKKEVRYHCSECNRGFVTPSSYKVHLKRHKGQRDYVCECGKTFYTSSCLKQHKVVHTGEKKYQCKLCKKKFTQTSHLNRHFKKDHSKPNMPLPPSDYFKLVISKTGDDYYGSADAVKNEDL